MIYIVPLLSVILGYLLALYLQPKNKQKLKLLLAFSGAFLLSLTVLHLLPEVYEMEAHDHGTSDHAIHMGVFIMVGILFQIVLEYFSKGAEHGHVHTHNHMDKMPWLLFISLCLHAFLEGFPVSHHHELAWGIGIHHFPIAIILTIFFLNSKLSNPAIMAFMLSFAFMTPLGTLVSEQVPFIGHYYAEISAVVVGVLFHISSTIIFESSEEHKFNLRKLVAIIMGVALAYFI